MKVWLTQDTIAGEPTERWVIWLDNPTRDGREVAQILAAALPERTIRAMGCTKKLPTDKQVIVVNLSLK